MRERTYRITPLGLPLTDHDRVIVALVSLGLTDKAIALRLVNSPRTIENIVFRIKQKLDIRSRVELALWWERQQPT